MGQVLARYNNWSTNPTLAWQTAMPSNIYSLDMAGQFLFAAPILPATDIYVIDKTTGMYAGTVSAANVMSGWDDVPYGLSAYQRANGDYLLFQEDDGYDKINMYTISNSSHLPPLVAIASPLDRSAYSLSSTIPIIATASAASGSSISQVQYYVDGILMGTQTTGSGNSYSYTLPSLPLGPYTITCTAVDSTGARTTSFPINVIVANNGLVGWWKFDEDSGSSSADSSGIGNTLSLSGTSWTTGKFGSALSFNGSASASGQSWKGLVPRTALTVSAWVQSSTSTWSGGLFVLQDNNYYLARQPVGAAPQSVLAYIQTWSLCITKPTIPHRKALILPPGIIMPAATMEPT